MSEQDKRQKAEPTEAKDCGCIERIKQQLIRLPLPHRSKIRRVGVA
jgi:hypothetical protein